MLPLLIGRCLISTTYPLFLIGPFFLPSELAGTMGNDSFFMRLCVSHTCVLTKWVQMTLTSMNEPVKPSFEQENGQSISSRFTAHLSRA